MSEEIKIYFDEDGIAKEYDDTYDITIHCESEEEQNELLDRLNRQWIPVSERLPEKDGEYLVTVKSTFKNMRNYIKHCDFARNLYLVDEYDFVERRGIAGFYKYDSEYGYYEVLNAVAWMPLPEPYRASLTGAESEVQDADSN